MSKTVRPAAREMFLSGNEAIALGAYESGLRVACAYPGTPSTEILETLAKFGDIDAQWSVNEKVAFEVALGAAIGGARSLFACKHVGLNVAMDPLMTASYTGIKAGLVAIVADDPGLHSSQNEQDSRWVAVFSKLPMLEPASPAEAKVFTKEAFGISEAFDTPVLIRSSTRVSHTRENVEVLAHSQLPPIAELAPDIPKYVMVPKNAYQRHILVEQRLSKLKTFAEKTKLNRLEKGSKSIGFITSGVSFNYLKEYFPHASYLKLGMIWPLPDKKIIAFAKSVKQCYVVEELDPFISTYVKSLGLKIKTRHPSFEVGELRPEYIPDIVAGKKKQELAATTRKPVLCRGCPHRFVFNTLKKLKTFVTGDIGCYTLAATPPMSTLHTCVCMGAGITLHEGIRRAQPGKKIVGVIGDSTFVHSGITGLINAAYNKVKGVIVILDNSTTAMTGGQHHPATGKTIKEEPTKKLILEDICRACGADNVDVVVPYRLNELEDILKKRLDEDALSVVITRSPCRLLDRTIDQPPLYERDKCKACGVCLRIDCPAIHKLPDGTIEIDEFCAGCKLCVSVCPFGALTRRPEDTFGKD
jgi:indolepyruvate ferredoxin oxidoreductase alpha subunit